MKPGHISLLATLYLVALALLLLPVGETMADDWSWSNPPPGTRSVVSNQNPEKNTVATAYDSQGNIIREEIFNRTEPTGEEPDAKGEEPNFTAIKGSDPNRREKAYEACNNSCEMHFSGSSVDMTEGDIVVIPNDSGKVQQYADDGDGYRCLSGCEEDTPPTSGDDGDGDSGGGGGGGAGSSGGGGSGGGSGGGGSAGGDSSGQAGDDGAGGNESENERNCQPGGGLQCWEEDKRICLCGGGDRYTLGMYRECTPRTSCITGYSNSMLFVRSCEGANAEITPYWLVPKRTNYFCLKPSYVAPANPDRLQQAQERCGHLVGDGCDGGGERCRNIACPVDAESIERVEYELSNGRMSSFFCRKCLRPLN